MEYPLGGLKMNIKSIIYKDDILAENVNVLVLPRVGEAIFVEDKDRDYQVDHILHYPGVKPTVVVSVI